MERVIRIGRYENKELNEFWSAEIHGKFVTIHFGSIGATGHRATREFDNHAMAKAFVEEQVRKKLDRGYELIE